MSSEQTSAAGQQSLFAEYPRIEVVRSKRRKKTVEAVRGDGVLRISVPHNISREEEAHWVQELVAAAQAEHISTDEQLRERAEVLAEKYRLPVPRKIEFVKDLSSRWAYCDHRKQEIGVCRRVQKFTLWVVDYVIVHELAHLIEDNHSPAFWELVNRYPKAQRARGYLDAKAEEASFNS